MANVFSTFKQEVYLAEIFASIVCRLVYSINMVRSLAGRNFSNRCRENANGNDIFGFT